MKKEIFDSNKFWILSGKEQSLSIESFETENLAKIEIMTNDLLYSVSDYFSIVTGQIALMIFNQEESVLNRPIKKELS